MNAVQQALALMGLFEHSQNLKAQEGQAALALQVLRRGLSKEHAEARFWGSARAIGAAA